MILQAIDTNIMYEGVPRNEEATQILTDSEFIIHKRYVCIQSANCSPIDKLFNSPENIPVFWECPECTAIAPEDSYYYQTS